MSIRGRMSFQAELNKPVRSHDLGVLVCGDREEMRYEVQVTDGGAAVDCRGMSVTAYLMRGDGQTVVWQGAAGGTGVTFTIPQEAHACPGAFTLAVRVTWDEVCRTVFCAEGLMRPASGEVQVEAGQIIPTLDDLLARIGEMERATQAARQAAAAIPAHRINAAGDLVITL